MGWKNVKEHYRIGHIVQVHPKKGICIGSPYIHDLIVVGFGGTVTARYQRENDELGRYQQEMLGDMETLRKLVTSPDTFEKSITIWTYDGADIIEKKCEVPEWPNVTHDGAMIYENTFSTDRAKVIQWAKENAEAYLKNSLDALDNARKRLSDCELRVAKARCHIDRLNSLTTSTDSG